jgi:MFS family permease
VKREHLALLLLCLASFMAVVDTTIVSIALPSMRRELGFSGADAQWILNGYALAFGGLLLLLGRAGDLYGRRRLFVAGPLHGSWSVRASCRVSARRRSCLPRSRC